MLRIVLHQVLARQATHEQQSWEGLELCCIPTTACVLTIARILCGLPCQLPPRARPSFRLRAFRLTQVHYDLNLGYGVTSLPLWLGQHQWPPVPYMVRLCMHCDMSAHGNEPHVLFEYPATQATPAPYALLFLAGCSMLEFMHHANTHGPAKCILACLRAHDRPPQAKHPYQGRHPAAVVVGRKV